MPSKEIFFQILWVIIMSKKKKIIIFCSISILCVLALVPKPVVIDFADPIPLTDCKTIYHDVFLSPIQYEFRASNSVSGGGLAEGLDEMEEDILTVAVNSGSEIYGVTRLIAVTSMPNILELIFHQKKYNIENVSVIGATMGKIEDIIEHRLGFILYL